MEQATKGTARTIVRRRQYPQVLRDEHRVAARRAGHGRGQTPSSAAPRRRERVTGMIDFTRSFTDACHHLKRGRLLFPRLRERSPEPGAIAMMLASASWAASTCGDEAALPRACSGDREPRRGRRQPARLRLCSRRTSARRTRCCSRSPIASSPPRIGRTAKESSW